VGRQVGTPVVFGASYVGWRALLEAAGLGEAGIELVSIGYTQVAALTEGQVDAAICYAMNEPVQMQVSGYDLDIIYVADYINLVSNGLITNEATAREAPELVRGMVRAALRGLAFTLDHPDEAFEISRQYVPELAGDNEAVNRAVLAESIRFWQAPPSELGRSYEEEWRASQRVMAQMELIGTERDVTTMFTNRFVDEVDLPGGEDGP
jgi:NitT/TauT family transport system substrate-binding protein